MTPDILMDNMQSLAMSEVANANVVLNTVYSAIGALKPPKLNGLTLTTPDITYELANPIAGNSMADMNAVLEQINTMLQALPDDMANAAALMQSHQALIDPLLSEIDQYNPEAMEAMYNAAYRATIVASQQWYQGFIAQFSPVNAASIAAANSRLITMINGLGLPDDVINAIWQTARDQVTAESLTATATAIDLFASKGYALPPGALSAQIQNIQFQRMGKVASVSRDVAIEQAKIIVDFMKFGTQTALTVHEQFISGTTRLLGDILSGYTNGLAQVLVGPLRERVALLTGLIDALLRGDSEYIRALGSEATALGQVVNAVAEPYKLEAFIAEANSKIAAANAQIQTAVAEVGVKVQAIEADYTSKIDATQLDGYYRLEATLYNDLATVAGDYARIAAAAIGGLNAVASSASISF